MTDPNGRPLLTVYRRGEHDEPAAATPAVIAVVGEVDLRRLRILTGAGLLVREKRGVGRTTAWWRPPSPQPAP